MSKPPMQASPIVQGRETKADRRDRILTEARALLAAGGSEGMSLRRLATRARVTVPTIYNLVGGKSQVLLELTTELVVEIEGALEAIAEVRPLERAEAVICGAISAFERAPEFHRAALLAIDALDRDARGPDWDRLGERASAMQEKAALAAQAAGLLEGRIPARLIGEHIFRTYRSASRDWSRRRLSLAEFRRIALSGVYLAFAADASEPFRRHLATRLNRLGSIAGEA
jgi:AcrR family transcriptional regulator